MTAARSLVRGADKRFTAMLHKLIRLLKILDAWILDLLYPDVGQSDDDNHFFP